jgi:hypothetical protein
VDNIILDVLLTLKSSHSGERQVFVHPDAWPAEQVSGAVSLKASWHVQVKHVIAE